MWLLNEDGILGPTQHEDQKVVHVSSWCISEHGCSLISPTLGSPVVKPHLQSEGKRDRFSISNTNVIIEKTLHATVYAMEILHTAPREAIYSGKLTPHPFPLAHPQ